MLARATNSALLAVFAVAFDARAQDAIGPTRTTRSLLQPQQETQLVQPSYKTDEFMTGDWGGARTRLHEEGIDFFGFYNNIISGNASGGVHPGHVTYDHDIWLGLKFDLEKLVGWTGGQFVISGIDREGTGDLTHQYIRSTYSVQQLVGGQRTFLYQVYLQQKLLNDRLTFKLGRYGASDDFNTNPLYGYSLNNGINGNIRNVLFDTRFSAYPFAAWAASMFVDPTPELHFKLGIFQTSRDMFENDRHGLDLEFLNDDGYTTIAQIGWTPKLNGMPGHYWLGMTYSGFDYYARFLGGFEDQSYGWYVNLDQMIYAEEPGSDQGLTAFIACGYYPQPEISIVPFQVESGLNYKGLFPGRDDDHTMLHFIYGKLSNEYALSVRANTPHRAESEKVLEFAHRFQLKKWAYFQPDLQWVIDPGGTGDIPDAVVIGAQMGVTF